MITIFEAYNSSKDPQVDDYVIIGNEYQKYNDTLVVEFFGKIGRVVKIVITNKLYKVRDFDNDANALYFSRKEISHFSKNKEDLELIVNAGKFNL